MLDYIFVDYLYYIFYLFFYVSIGVFSACVIYMMLLGNNKVVRGFLIFSVLAFLSGIIYPNFLHSGNVPHYNCNSKIEREASNIHSALADYFSIPDRTQLPSYSDLVKSGHYFLKNMDSNRRDKLIKDSEFSVTILGDVSEILIVLSCKEGRCPFYRWKCPRQIRGKIYVRRMGGSGANGWFNGYEDI